MAFKRKMSAKRNVKKTYKKKYVAKRRTRLTTLIRRVVSRTAESKVVDRAVPKTEMYHNSSHYFIVNDTSGYPIQGTAGTQRIGDEIYVKGFKVRLLFGQKSDRPNVSFRIVIGHANKAWTWNYSSFMRNVTGNVLLDPPNPDVFKVIKTYTLRPNEAGLNATGNDEYTFTHSAWIPYNKKIRFPVGNQDADGDNLFFVIFPYDAYGTLTSDNIAYYQAACSCHYKDI